MTDTASDQIIPFHLKKAPIRGRLVRLDTVIADILKPHNYPPLVNRYLTEAIALSAALVSGFKFDGIFTLQISGAGPLRLIVVDVKSNGDIRACARFDAEGISKLENKLHSVQSVMGAGYLAFTVDQNESDDRYQGTVELIGPTFAECLHHFFRQSEQLATGITTAISSSTPETNHYTVAALMVQKIPSTSSRNLEDLEKESDDWLRILSILGTTTGKELLDKNLSSSDLLYRLFWEDDVYVLDEKKLTAKCRCSPERIEGMLKTFSQDDRKAMVVNHKIIVTCEFCSTTYEFEESEFV